MVKFYSLGMFVFLLSACSRVASLQEHKTIAERYSRGMWGCGSTALEDRCRLIQYSQVFHQLVKKRAGAASH